MDLKTSQRISESFRIRGLNPTTIELTSTYTESSKRIKYSLGVLFRFGYTLDYVYAETYTDDLPTAIIDLTDQVAEKVFDRHAYTTD